MTTRRTPPGAGTPNPADDRDFWRAAAAVYRGLVIGVSLGLGDHRS